MVASGLCLPEGPLVTAAGRMLFVQIGRGEVCELHPDGGVSTHAVVAGAPHALLEDADGRIFITQAGDVDIAGPTPEPIEAGIQVLSPDGEVSWLVREVDGVPLVAPNDLCFGADGRLYFTDSGGGYDPTATDQRSRVCAVDAGGRAETVVWLGASYANGIGCDRDGVLHWTESYNNRLCALGEGEQRPALALDSPPDGILHAKDGRVAVAATVGGLQIARRLDAAADAEARYEVVATFAEPTFATNVASDGEALYVTDFGDYFGPRGREGSGAVWRVELPLEPVTTGGPR